MENDKPLNNVILTKGYNIEKKLGVVYYGNNFNG